MLLYAVGLVPVSLAVFLIFTVKAVPIFLSTIVEFTRAFSLSSAIGWYWKVLAGKHGEGNNNSAASTELVRVHEYVPTEPIGRSATGHAYWVKIVQRSTKGIIRFIKGYAKMKICKIYSDQIKCYFKSIKCINPIKLGKILTSYCHDANPCNCMQDVGCAILVLWFPLLLALIMWSLGLCLVLTVPPFTFLSVLGLWILGWPLVLAFLPVAYILGWVLIIFGLPLLYIFGWIMILIGPWIFCVAGSLSGPLLALKIPITMIKYNHNNPISKHRYIYI